MKEIKISQTKNNGKTTVEMWFKCLDQLFDPSDSFPFPEKELSDLAEESIFGQFIDLYIRKDDDLIIHIPEGRISVDCEDLMAKAVNRHFTFRLIDIAQEKKSSWREGKVSVLLALMNAAISMFLFHTFYYQAESSFLFSIIVGVFIITNWVTIWDTYEYFVYDYRKLWRKYKVYEKLSHTHVSVKQTR